MLKQWFKWKIYYRSSAHQFRLKILRIMFQPGNLTRAINNEMSALWDSGVRVHAFPSHIMLSQYNIFCLFDRRHCNFVHNILLLVALAKTLKSDRYTSLFRSFLPTRVVCAVLWQDDFVDKWDMQFEWPKCRCVITS